MAMRAALRKLVPSSARLAMARALCSEPAGRLTGALLRYRIRHQGLVFDTRDPAFLPTVRAAMLWGVHEGDETRMIQRHLVGASQVVELGASLGITGAHAVSALAAGGRYIGVEANPALIDPLRATLDDHRGTREVTVVNAAISDVDGAQVDLVVGDQPQDSHLASEGGGPGTTVTVPTLTLSGLLAAHDVADGYALISDIEGAERYFIYDGTGALDGCRRLVIELHDNPAHSVEDMLDTLISTHGFHVLDRRGVVVALGR
jgi:FkbM family methyltransferase